jgi:hypothetical protein
MVSEGVSNQTPRLGCMATTTPPSDAYALTAEHDLIQRLVIARSLR